MSYRTDMNGTTSKLFHAGQIDAQVAATAARDPTVSKAAVKSSRQSADTCPLSAASSGSLQTLVTAVSVLWYLRYADCVLGISRLLSRKA